MIEIVQGRQVFTALFVDLLLEIVFSFILIINFLRFAVLWCYNISKLTNQFADVISYIFVFVSVCGYVNGWMKTYIARLIDSTAL